MCYNLGLLKRASLPLFLVFALSGCQLIGLPGEHSDISFTTDQRSYSPGDSLTLQLENHSDRSFQYNLCESQLEHRTQSDWQEIEENRGCYEAYRTLDPGERGIFKIKLADDLTEGTYRYTNRIHYEASDFERIMTNVFRIDE